MNRIRRIGTAAVVAAVMAAFLTFGGATVEAKGGKKGGGDANAAICQYLANILNYEYLSPYIRPYVETLFTNYQCDPALLN
jgi:malic enzyme